MGIIADIGGILAAGAGGGILGLVGSGVNRVMGFFERKEDRKHQIAMAEINEKADLRKAEIEAAKSTRDHEHLVKLHQLNLEAQKGETEREHMLMREAGSWEGLKASHETAAIEAANFSGSVWVEDFKAATRPALTFLLWVFVALFFIWAGAGARLEIIQAVIFCATAATLWWFGDRAPKYKQTGWTAPSGSEGAQ